VDPTAGASADVANILALQRAVGNAAVTRVLARGGYAAKEPPKLERPIGAELAQHRPWELVAERRRVWTRLEAARKALRSGTASYADDLRSFETIEATLASDSYRHSQEQVFHHELEALLPEIAESLERDDDRVRVVVDRVYVKRDPGWQRSHVISADLSISKKVAFSGYGAPQMAGRLITLERRKKTVTVLEADFETNEITFPEPGLVSEGLGFLEYISPSRAVLSLGKAGLKAAAKRGARGAVAKDTSAGFRAWWQRAMKRMRPTKASGRGNERLRLMHGTGQKGFEGIGAVGKGRIDVKYASGDPKDLGPGFYLSTDKKIAEDFAKLRGRREGELQHVLSFEVSVQDLGKVVDIRRGGRFHDEWQRFLDEDAFTAIFGAPVPFYKTAVRTYLTTGKGPDARSHAFELFLKKIGMRNADTILAPSGADVYRAVAVGRDSMQVCIRSQRVADRLNAIIRGDR
jgi:hypothetical protein